MVEARGGEEAAEIAGVRIGKMHPPLQSGDFVRCTDSKELDHRRIARAILLATCASGVTLSSIQELAPVRKVLDASFESFLALKQLSDLASKRHFEGRPLLFRPDGGKLDELIRLHETLAAEFNDLAPTFELSTLGERAPGRFRLADAQRRAHKRAGCWLELIEALALALFPQRPGDSEATKRVLQK
jgi:hypothetical protein